MGIGYSLGSRSGLWFPPSSELELELCEPFVAPFPDDDEPVFVNGLLGFDRRLLSCEECETK
jgi:hypothetical protein